MESPFTNRGQTILVTGASSGIGRQCAISLSYSGANVILFGRNENALKETAHLMSPEVNYRICSIDLREVEALELEVKQSVEKIGKINGVIHSAGISTTLPLRVTSPDKTNHFLQVNVTSAIELTRIVSKRKYFSENGGSIIFISSVMGMVGEAGKTIYSLTKGALIAGTKSLAIELANKRIRVNCISPGVVETPMSNSAVYSQSEVSRKEIEHLHPLGLGKPEDIANACIFLLSDASRWITGTNLVIDGGYTAH